MKTMTPRLLATLAMSSMLAACGGGGGDSGTTPPVTPPAPAPVCTASAAIPDPGPTAPQVTLAVTNGVGVNGNVVLTLDAVRAPITTANFLAYVNSGFFNGTVIHRHSPGFVLQGGGWAGPIAVGGAWPARKPNATGPIVLEDNVGLSNLCLTVAMARTSAPDSATSEFFINIANNTGLDRTATARGYAVFGSVTSGASIVTAMTTATCSSWAAYPFGGDCLPAPNITITSATRTR
jgi:cyclophilin family peptidyl-prolyl cis-trans isomerase